MLLIRLPACSMVQPTADLRICTLTNLGMTQPFLHAKLENTHSHSRKLLYATMARRLDIPLFHFAQQAMRAAENVRFACE